jgi:hypothetical protein
VIFITAAIAAVALFAGLVILNPAGIMTTTLYAQQQPSAPQKQHAQFHSLQEQQLSHCDASVLNSLPPLVPGAFPVCVGSPLMPTIPSGPSQAQIQSDLAKHPPGQIADQIISQVKARLAHSPPGTTFDQILQQMTDQGLMDCPAIKNPSHACMITPPPKGPISPPIAP